MSTIQDFNLVYQVSRVLIVAAISFIVAIILTPLFTNILYKYKIGKQIRSEGAPVFNSLHQKKQGTPTMGGILVWLTVFLVMVVFWAPDYIFNNQIKTFDFLNFLTRKQTLLPLGVLIVSALVGAADDLLGVKGIGPKGGGLRIRERLLLYTLVAVGGAWWFYYKLGWDILHIPGLGDYNIGIWYIPLFLLVIVATSFSVNETDGLDGLAGGLLGIAFGAYGAIAFSQGRYELAIFCGAIAGALLAFLWFNVYPARFFMGDTGTMSLGITLGVIAMLTNSVAVLPLIGFVFMLESTSVIIQVLSKRLRGKKVFISAPIHHHFEALGWPETKVTMRFWIIGAITAILGLVIGLIGRG